MKSITTSNFANVPTIKPIFTLITIKADYQANTLDEVVKLWAKSKDYTEIIGINRLG